MTTQTLIPPPPSAAKKIAGSTARPTGAARRGESFFPMLLLPPLAAALAWIIHRALPNRQTNLPTHLYPLLLEVLFAMTMAVLVVQIAWLQLAGKRVSRADSRFDAAGSSVLAWLKTNAALMAGAIMALCLWDLVTLKLNLVPLPYFPGPDLILQSLREDGQLLLNCTWHSLLLLITGYVLGALLGVISGVLIGWSKQCRYWGMPLLKTIGPIPATAFIPLALMLFPAAFTSAVALIALAVWFPVTMLTASGVANVRVSLIDVARTLGARPAFLVFRVAIPAAMPSIFVGLFMGLGASFLTLVVAETVGVTSGLGWYMSWARAWADYPKVYAALVIMAIFFSGIMTLLFKLRDHVLVYQKGTIKW